MTFKKTQWNAGAAPGVSAAQLLRMEQGIWDAYMQSGAMFLEGAVLSLTNNATTGNLEQVDERVGGVLRRRTILIYTGSDLSTARTIIYAEDGTTIIKDYTDTLGYDSGSLSSVTRAVSV